MLETRLRSFISDTTGGSTNTASLVQSSRTISTVYPLSGGGDLSVNRSHAVDTAFLVNTGRTISSGTGLSGGGNLSADRTISLNTPVSISNGGTGTSSFPTNAVLYGNDTGPISNTPAALINQVLRMPGGAGSPAFGAIDLSKVAAVSNTLAVTNGGTGQSTLTNRGFLIGSGLTAIQVLAALNSGELIVGSSTLLEPQILGAGSQGTMLVSDSSTRLGVAWINTAAAGGGGGILVPLIISSGGTNSTTALNNNRIMVSSSGSIKESESITDGESIQRINTAFLSCPLPLSTCEGRMSLESGTAVTLKNVSGGTLYFAPYKGNRIYLYDGARWRLYSFTEMSTALTVTSSNNYDVFIYDNSGTLSLELSAAWSSNTVRVDTLNTVNGVLVKSSSTLRRYVGTIRASSTNFVEDSVTNRFVSNFYNQVQRSLFTCPGYVDDNAYTSFTYASTSWGRANGGTGSRLNFLTLAGNVVSCENWCQVVLAGANIGIGIDSTTTSKTETYLGSAGVDITVGSSYIDSTLAEGFHYAEFLVRNAGGTSTYYVDASRGGGSTDPYAGYILGYIYG